MRIIYTIDMGAGKGINRRVNIASNASTSEQKQPKPKFNLDDRISGEFAGPILREVVIHRIFYNEKTSTYEYMCGDDSQDWTPALKESEITLVESSLLDKRGDDYRNCLHKIVTFQHHPEGHKDLRQFDGQEACIIGVGHSVFQDGKIGFHVRFCTADEKLGQELQSVEFMKDDFSLAIQAVDAKELDDTLVF